MSTTEHLSKPTPAPETSAQIFSAQQINPGRVFAKPKNLFVATTLSSDQDPQPSSTLESGLYTVETLTVPILEPTSSTTTNNAPQEVTSDQGSQPSTRVTHTTTYSKLPPTSAVRLEPVPTSEDEITNLNSSRIRDIPLNSAMYESVMDAKSSMLRLQPSSTTTAFASNCSHTMPTSSFTSTVIPTPPNSGLAEDSSFVGVRITTTRTRTITSVVSMPTLTEGMPFETITQSGMLADAIPTQGTSTWIATSSKRESSIETSVASTSCASISTEVPFDHGTTTLRTSITKDPFTSTPTSTPYAGHIPSGIAFLDVSSASVPSRINELSTFTSTMVASKTIPMIPWESGSVTFGSASSFTTSTTSSVVDINAVSSSLLGSVATAAAASQTIIVVSVMDHQMEGPPPVKTITCVRTQTIHPSGPGLSNPTSTQLSPMIPTDPCASSNSSSITTALLRTSLIRSILPTDIAKIPTSTPLESIRSSSTPELSSLQPTTTVATTTSSSPPELSSLQPTTTVATTISSSTTKLSSILPTTAVDTTRSSSTTKLSSILPTTAVDTTTSSSTPELSSLPPTTTVATTSLGNYLPTQAGATNSAESSQSGVTFELDNNLNTPSIPSSSATETAAASSSPTLTTTQTVGMAVGGTVFLIFAAVAIIFVVRRYLNKRADRNISPKEAYLHDPKIGGGSKGGRDYDAEALIYGGPRRSPPGGNSSRFSLNNGQRYSTGPTPLKRSSDSGNPFRDREYPYQDDPRPPTANSFHNSNNATAVFSGAMAGYAMGSQRSPPMSRYSYGQSHPYRPAPTFSPTFTPRGSHARSISASIMEYNAQLDNTPYAVGSPAALDYPTLSPYERPSLAAMRESKYSDNDSLSDPFEHDLLMHVDTRSEYSDFVTVIASPTAVRTPTSRTPIGPRLPIRTSARSSLPSPMSSRYTPKSHLRVSSEQSALSNGSSSVAQRFSLAYDNNTSSTYLAPSNEKEQASLLTMLPLAPVREDYKEIKRFSLAYDTNTSTTYLAPTTNKVPALSSSNPSPLHFTPSTIQDPALSNAKQTLLSPHYGEPTSFQMLGVRGMRGDRRKSPTFTESMYSNDSVAHRKRTAETEFADPVLIGRSF